jgi:predicted DsbA family dithiol-disulfide isomerase
MSGAVPDNIVQIWLDVVCPYCYIGKERLRKGVALTSGSRAIALQDRAYEIDPHASPTPGTGLAAAARKYGMTESALIAAERQIGAQADAEGLPYVVERPFGNTFDIHRVLQHAEGHGLRGLLTDRVQRAHFGGEMSVFEEASLVELAEEVGLDGGRARDVLASDIGAAEVRQEIAVGRERGVHVVPYVLVGEGPGLVGAQPTEAYADAIGRA